MEKACVGSAIKEPPSFSIGMAIIHQRNPLHESLNKVRKAEACAKHEGGRAALAIIQDKRNGSEISVYGKWYSQNGLQGLDERMQGFIEGYGTDSGVKLPSRLAYQLRALIKEYGAGGQGETAGFLQFQNDLPDNVLTAETLRILEHKKMKGNNLKLLLGGQTDLGALSNEMVISRQLFEALDLAKGLWNAHQKGEQ